MKGTWQSQVFLLYLSYMKRFWIVILIIFIVGALFLVNRATNTTVATSAALETLLVDDGDNAGFKRATEPNAIEFPRDLGSHEDYQTEWWYYTGNLESENGRPFGFQFTIFRRALMPPKDTNVVSANSNFRTDQIYLAHFTVSDIANEEFYATERFSRGAAGLAGAQAEPYRVWLEDWSVEEIAPGQVQLQAQTDEVGLDLVLTQTMPPVLHGDGGLSLKGVGPGNASYYYSLVQQAVTGDVRIGEELSAVNGRSWKDHEYSTSALSPGSVGWDWFSLQFDDHPDAAALMLFQIRRDDGSIEPASNGSFITNDGQVQQLSSADWQIEILDSWTSPTSGGVYPAGWRITIPSIDLVLEGRPLLANQELNVSTVYWEGAVDFSGTLGSEPITAQGYIEMTGYSSTMGNP